MTTVHTLSSGSSGNAVLLSCDHTHLLIDAGISCRRIITSLRKLGLTGSDLTAVLVTHTHSDHISGLQVLMKQGNFPILASERACRELEYRLAGTANRLVPLELCQPTTLNHCSIVPIPLSHDAPGACGYRIETEDGSVGILTDTGFITEAAAEFLPGVDLAILEANHDIDKLRSGPYPYYLKERILGSEGHLSNSAAAEFAVTLAKNGASQIILAHLSRENNTPAMAHSVVKTALSAADLSPDLSVAPRDDLSQTYTVCRRMICKK